MLQENLIFNKTDIEINVNKFESGESNILLITGFSGSGKSTLAKELAAEYNSKNFELDCLDFYCYEQATKEDLKEETGLLAFIEATNLQPNKNLNNKDLYTLYREYIKFLINWCKQQSNEKFIIEGLQIYDTFKEGDYHITNCPIIIKGTSAIISAIRAAKRNEGNSLKNFGDLIKFILKDNKNLNTLSKNINKQKTFADEFNDYSTMWD